MLVPSVVLAGAALLLPSLASADPNPTFGHGYTSCSYNQFWHAPLSSCLPLVSTPSPCPSSWGSDRSCPPKYTPWQNKCVPINPGSYKPEPTCPTFGHKWDAPSQCCKKAYIPAPPPTPQCSKNQFWWQTKSCCLPHGGIPNPTPPPPEKTCPSNWQWHGGKSCCVPTIPSPPPVPTCSRGSWDGPGQCCNIPKPPPPPPQSQCSKTQFWWQTKSCCLPHGGIPNPTPPPPEKTCPSNWQWHGGKSCCVPTIPSPPPVPTCPRGSWDGPGQCCNIPKPPPPPPTCGGNQFWWDKTKCCLPRGGIPKPSPCPTDKSCPKGWQWHGGKRVCVPIQPSPPPKPECGKGSWTGECCQHPPPPTPSGKPHNYGYHKRRIIQDQSLHFL